MAKKSKIKNYKDQKEKVAVTDPKIDSRENNSKVYELLEKAKKADKGKRMFRIDRNTVILVDKKNRNAEYAKEWKERVNESRNRFN